MEELIPIQKSKGGKDIVSARDLHEFLGIKSKLGDWMDRRIKKYGFIEKQDFVKVSQIKDTFGGPQEVYDYALTLDTAKELAMVEGNERGKTARQYFITCEKRLKTIMSHYIPSTLSEALRLAANQAEQIEKQQIQIAEMEPKSKAAEILLLSDDLVNIGEFAKAIGTGQNKLFNELRRDKFLIPEGGKRNLPYQKFINQGLFVVKEVTKVADNKVKVFSQTQITTKGQIVLANRYSSH